MFSRFPLHPRSFPPSWSLFHPSVYKFLSVLSSFLYKSAYPTKKEKKKANHPSPPPSDIAKYFGQSTADGIQFQFRAYKKDAEKLRTVHSSGGNVANCLPLSTLATPSKATPSRTTPTSRASTARKRPLGAKIKRSSSDDEDEASVDPEDWSDGDGDGAETPSRRPSKHARTAASTPSRRLAASKADATIARVSAQLGQDESPDDSGEETATMSQSTPAEYKSLFGDARASSANGNGHGHAGVPGEGLTTFSLDPYMSTTMSRSVYSDGPGRDDAYGDGEI